MSLIEMCPVNYDYPKCNKKGYNKGISNCTQCKHLVKTDKKYQLRRLIEKGGKYGYDK